MANQIPLIVNAGAGQIQQLAEGDNLSVAGNIVTGNILTDGYYYANGAPFIDTNTGNITFDNTDISTNLANTDITITGNGTGAVNIVTGDNGYTQLQNDSNANGSSYVWLQDGNVYIESDGNTWTFDSAGNLSSTGNIIGSYLYGDGSNITNLPAGDYGNANVAEYLPTFTGNLTANNISASGNINATNLDISNSITSGNFIGNLSNGTSKISIASGGNVSVGVGPFGTTVLNVNTSTGISVLGNVLASEYISASGNITGGNLFGNGSQLTGISYANISNTPPMVSPSYELHVAKNGNDTTGNGDVLNPYLTITEAVAMASNSFKIIVHAGEYIEDVTINNIDFLTITSVDAGGVGAPTPTILGNLTVSGTSTSTAIKNVGINQIITHSASGTLYLTDLSLGQSTNIGTLNKTGSGYLSVQNCNLGIASGNTLTNVNITGSGTVVFNNTQLAAVTVNNASASVSIVNNSNTLSVTLTVGTLNVFDSYMYTLGNSGFYAVNATGGVLQIRNSILVNPNQTPARVNLASPTVFAYDDIYFDRANSTLGISANAEVDFQSIRLSGALSVTGNITGGNILTTGQISATGNITGNYIFGNGSQLTGLSSTYGNTEVAAYLDGSAGNIIPGANLTYSLGNSTNWWSNIWVAGNTIYIGGVSLGMGADNVLTVDGNAVLQNNSNSSISTTGNITADYFIGNISTTGNIYAADINLTGNVYGSNGNLILSANIAQPQLEWLISNDNPAYAGPNNSALVTPVSDDIHIGEILFQATTGSAITTFAGPNNGPFSNAFNIISTANLLLTTQGNGNPHIWNFNDSGGLYFPRDSSKTTIDQDFEIGRGTDPIILSTHRSAPWPTCGVEPLRLRLSSVMSPITRHRI
jgi:hypothetical protein